MPPSTGLTSTRRTPPALKGTQGAGSNDRNSGSGGFHSEPADHGIGRSRGGLTSKIHHAVDGRRRPLAVLITPGHSLSRVPRAGAAHARTRPAAGLGDKAYASRANRTMLRKRRIQTVIPEPADQQANRQRKGSRGGRPPNFDADLYKQRNVVERS